MGQAVLNRSWDLASVRAVEDRLARRALDGGRLHAAMLRDVLALHAEHVSAGMALATEPAVALLLRVSEWKAGRLLHEALALSELPDGLEALEWGLLQPDQSWVLVRELQPLPPEQQLQLWERLLQRLAADAGSGAVLPPARLGNLLKVWVQQVAPQDAVERRRTAEEGRSVSYRKRDDGLADVFLLGIRATDAQAVLQRIRGASAPVGLWDERTADQRRLDAAVDLLLGRDVLGTSAGTGARCGSGCGCRPGEAAPCGSSINVHVTLNGSLGTTDEAATMDRHGPIEQDLLQALLLNAPVLRAVFVDEHGTPVGISRQRLRPERGDPESVRQALLRLGNLKPDRLFPVHPDGHAPPGASRSARPHPPDTPSPYRVTGLLRDLIAARSPRCEWIGCGMPARACDAEHDAAWPGGPTCSCNLGPCCRHHHRVKQLGWRKTRHPDGSVTWTDPFGRARTTSGQHEPLQPPVRDLLPVLRDSPWDELSPGEREEELWIRDGRPEDPAAYELRAIDVDPDDVPYPDKVDTRWSWDLDDPYVWQPAPPRRRDGESAVPSM